MHEAPPEAVDDAAPEPPPRPHTPGGRCPRWRPGGLRAPLPGLAVRVAREAPGVGRARGVPTLRRSHDVRHADRPAGELPRPASQLRDRRGAELGARAGAAAPAPQRPAAHRERLRAPRRPGHPRRPRCCPGTGGGGSDAERGAEGEHCASTARIGRAKDEARSFAGFPSDAAGFWCRGDRI